MIKDYLNKKEQKLKDGQEGILLENKKTKHKLYFWIMFSFFCVLVSLFLVFTIFSLFKKTKDSNYTVFKKEKNIRSEDNANLRNRLIDGVYVEDGKENFFPLAIMIDNHNDARPPSGIDRANLVFEAEAEGGITRYLTIFASDEEIPEIGPVRSARPYFIDWAHEFSALYAHVGGSPEALVKIKQDNIFDINEFYNEHYFWRSNYFNRPHNVFTSTKKLRSYIEKKNLKEASFFSWKFKDDKPKKDLPLSSKISIKFRFKTYIVDWVYDKENNNYVRYQDGKPHYTRSGEIISSKNVVLQYVDAEVVDEKLRLNMDVIGEGKASICLDGFCQEASWRKKTKSSRTRYYVDEREVEFNRGTTWIEVLRPEIEVVIN